MSAYLDNAATTCCMKKAAHLAEKVMTEAYGNPSSLHGMGIEAERYLKSARAQVAKSLKAKDKEIIFTSGGTESNNLAIFGTARAKKRRGRHLITTMVEHPSVYNAFAALEEEGYEVTYLPTDNNGRISCDVLRAAIRTDTILVSVMHVNNETGSIQPIEEIGDIVHEAAPEAVFHVDAVQSYSKLKLFPGRMGINLMSVSGHKLHAPKGSGFLYVREKTRILPILYGGGQEYSIRSGTENVPAIAGLSVAVDSIFSGERSHSMEMYELKKYLADGLLGIGGISVNGEVDESFAPHILNVSVEGVRSEVMLHALEDKGVYVSSGSACSSNHPSKSRTLTAMGLSNDRIDTAIRFSLSIMTTREEIDEAVSAVRQLAPLLRGFVRK